MAKLEKYSESRKARQELATMQQNDASAETDAAQFGSHPLDWRWQSHASLGPLMAW